MKEIIIDGEKINDMQELHDIFAKELSFPEWYGNNLDALHDMLTELGEDITVTLQNRDALYEKINVRYGRFIKMLEHAKKENEHITLLIK